MSSNVIPFPERKKDLQNDKVKELLAEFNELELSIMQLRMAQLSVATQLARVKPEESSP